MIVYVIFFFQAEDGIRGGHVTGVQTCALPIFGGGAAGQALALCADPWVRAGLPRGAAADLARRQARLQTRLARSEERRVGKESRSQRAHEHEMKKIQEHTNIN